MKASLVVAITAAASALWIGLAHAGGTDVKAGANYEKPGRALDHGADLVGGPSPRFSRSIGDDIKTGGDYDKPGRTIGDDIRTGGNYDKPGRELDIEWIDEEPVKTGGASDKPGRALQVDPARYQ